ncbi:TetR/AcrR family transcriptional regulator [Croceibacterium sp. LX-88]|uniref:TetR/AcrR family transcriptional regulator n=1 Tax=Croceibacterium selenioxidans TaxID=2838833 RepID=A0ABS5W4J0_9SPHN|nr:TetR/AcrR family transcriptional regulator [Croceibacterium selenioxidans]MBT2134203.1 TetR/AcrR family transcriptional regulator [Croceibacterium selenioxidans]
MTRDKTQAVPTAARGEPLRERVIDAAERLLRRGKADFSMRDLAAEAGVSFATPFNQFGSKAAIMHALSGRRIDTMAKRFAEMSPPPDAAGRVLLAVDTAVEVMLEEPEINRAVMGWIGTAGPSTGTVLAHSTTLWSLALGAGDGLSVEGRQEALRCLPEQLAFAFRGVLSFWTAGELSSDALASNAREITKTLLRGFAGRPLSRESAS